MTHEDVAVDVELLERRVDLGDDVLGRTRPVGAVAQAVAEGLDDHDPVVLGEIGDERLEVECGGGRPEPRQEHDVDRTAPGHDDVHLPPVDGHGPAVRLDPVALPTGRDGVHHGRRGQADREHRADRRHRHERSLRRLLHTSLPGEHLMCSALRSSIVGRVAARVSPAWSPR
ncbi:hypothetical protein D3C74_344300 [compost metagenome]